MHQYPLAIASNVAAKIAGLVAKLSRTWPAPCGPGSPRATAASSKKRPDGQYEVTVDVQAEKFYADSLGRETPTKLNDLIDVGVYGKPVEGKKQGKLIAVRRERMRQKSGKYTFVVKEEPFEAGIDPINFLVDRVPDDNLKRVDQL